MIYLIVGNPEELKFIVVYAAWAGVNKCHGKFVRDICIFGIEDLQDLVKLPYLFANKFYIDYQPLTYKCIEDWHFNKIKSERLPVDLEKN